MVHVVIFTIFAGLLVLAGYTWRGTPYPCEVQRPTLRTEPLRRTAVYIGEWI